MVLKIFSLVYCSFRRTKSIDFEVAHKIKFTCLIRFCSSTSGEILRSFYFKDKLKFIADWDLYLKICQKIESKSIEISPKQLAFVPLAATTLCKEKHFVDKVLIPWWAMIEKYLHAVPEYTLTSTVFHLSRINYFCSGEVIKSVNWSGIEKITQFALNNIRCNRFDAQNLSILTTALVNFIDDSIQHSNEISLSEELQLTLSRRFSEFFSPSVMKIKQKSDVLHSIGSILFNSSKLDFIKTPHDCLDKVIPLCLDRMNTVELDTTRKSLNECNKIGAAFLSWNYNPGPVFWSHYFAAIKKYYCSYAEKERFCVTVLKNCLLVGLKFNDDEFLRIAPFWKKEMFPMAQNLMRSEIEEILDVCLTKYSDDVNKIDNILSAEIFHILLDRTESFKVNDYGKLCYTGLPLDKNVDNLCMDDITYYLIRRQLIEGESSSISARNLCRFVCTVVEFRDEEKFVDEVFAKWWSTFELRLHDLSGYRIVHPLFSLSKVDKKLNGRLNYLLHSYIENPIEQMALIALKDIENKSFTPGTFSCLLASLEHFLLKPNHQQMSSNLVHDIAIGFNSYFNPDLFHQRSFAHNCHKQIGNILISASRFSVMKPSDERLKEIINCCSENFATELEKHGNDAYGHLWNLSQIMASFLTWNVDADKYCTSFWKLLFKEIETNYPRLANSQNNLTKLKLLLLKNILWIVLKFDKENEFKSLKNVWQTEARQLNFVNWLTYKDREEFYKFDNLKNIVSRPIFDEFKNRVRLR